MGTDRCCCAGRVGASCCGALSGRRGARRRFKAGWGLAALCALVLASCAEASEQPAGTAQPDRRELSDDSEPAEPTVPAADTADVVDEAYDGRGYYEVGRGRTEPPEGVFVDVSVSQERSCAVRDDAMLLCWGDADVRGEVPEGRYTRVSLGPSGGCAIRTDGEMACWHDGSWGEFDLPTGRFTDVLASQMDHSRIDVAGCGVRVGGELDCWGSDVWFRPVLPQERFQQMAGQTGFGAMCALGANGELACWGDSRNFARDMAPEGRFTDLDDAVNLTCGLRADGAVECWKNSYGADLREGEASLLGVREGDYTQMAVGGYHVCALTADRDMDCWGDNSHGQGEPRQGPFTQIAAGRGASCGLRASGQVSCWGRRADTDEPGRWDSPQGVFVQFDTWGPTCGVRTDTTLACWGYQRDDDGTARRNYGTGTDGRVERLPHGAGFAAIRIGVDEACASRVNGTLECWGQYNSPARQPLIGDFEHFWAWDALSSDSESGYCTLKTDGTLYCNDEQWRAELPEGRFLALPTGDCWVLTDGSVACKNVDDGPPTGSKPLRDASARGDVVCAIDDSGKTACWLQSWDNGVFEQIEPDSLAYRQGHQEHALPTTGLLRFADRSTGCAIDTAGELRGFCAYEPRGIYGDDPDEDLLEEPPAGLFAKAALSGSHACGIRLNSTLDCWGYPYDVYTLDEEPYVE